MGKIQESSHVRRAFCGGGYAEFLSIVFDLLARDFLCRPVPAEPPHKLRNCGLNLLAFPICKGFQEFTRQGVQRQVEIAIHAQFSLMLMQTARARGTSTKS